MRKDIPQQPMCGSIGETIKYCCAQLQQSDVFFGHTTDNPWDESVLLVLSVLELPLASGDEVLDVAVEANALSQIALLLERRITARIPMPYLLGKAQFAGLEFICDERAIIPRSPIAELILSGFEPWYRGPEPTRLLDLCCGGGCLGLAAAYYQPDLQVDLLDIDESALSLASENIALLGLGERVNLRQSDVFSQLASQTYDIIVSNPPYVNASDLADMPAEYHHEPELALGSGTDGLLITRKILASALSYLSANGLLVLEVGNSWVGLESLYPQVPFTWIEFASGGHGVLAITAKELREYSTSLQL